MTHENEENSSLVEEKDNRTLPEKFLDTVNRIKVHREQADLFSADLDLQRKRFDVEKSLFGKVAAKFTALSWWLKGLIALLVGATALSIGFALTLAWAITLPILSLSLYSFLVYIFSDYTSSDENRFSQLSEGLVRREEEMKGSIAELQTAENELFELIGKLNEFEQTNAEVIEKYSQQARLLEERVGRYEQVVLQFEQLQAALSAHSENIQGIESEFSTDLLQITRNFSQQFERMRQNTEVVELTTQELQGKVAEFKILPLRVDADPSISSRFEKLMAVDVEETENARAKNQERLAQEAAFLAKSDTFILEMGRFLQQGSEPKQCRIVINDDQEKPGSMRLN